jgi:hypothetical protein
MMMNTSIKKGLLAAAAAGAMLIGAASSASAFTLNYDGGIKFEFGNFDSGTTGYPVLGAPGTVCGSIGACDAAGSLPAPEQIGSEDTWGIASISRIVTETGGTDLWVNGQGGQYMTAMFYGLTDQRVDYDGSLGSTNFWTAYATGGILDVYLDANNDYSGAAGPSARTDLSHYPGATEGELFLRLAFGTGAAANDPTATYASSFNDGQASASGSGFLDIIGGSGADLFEQDTLLGFDGLLHDMFLDVVFNNVTGNVEWTVTSVGSVKAVVVPEPSTLALLGGSLLIGAFGAGAYRRKRSVA